MTLGVAKQIAKELISKYCSDYRFSFDKAKRRLGRCNNLTKEISISKYYIELNNPSEDKVRDLVLHEIAHALTPGDHHGKKWKKKCVELGCSTNRCSDENINVPSKYELVCPVCSRVYKMNRIRNTLYYCHCSNKDRKNYLNIYENGKIIFKAENKND